MLVPHHNQNQNQPNVKSLGSRAELTADVVLWWGVCVCTCVPAHRWLFASGANTKAWLQVERAQQQHSATAAAAPGPHPHTASAGCGNVSASGSPQLLLNTIPTQATAATGGGGFGAGHRRRRLSALDAPSLDLERLLGDLEVEDAHRERLGPLWQAAAPWAERFAAAFVQRRFR